MEARHRAARQRPGHAAGGFLSPHWPWKRRRGGDGEPAPAAAGPARFNAAALAEAVTQIGASVYGVDVGPPDPAVPALEVEAALAGIAAALLEGSFPADGGAGYLVKLAALAAAGMPGGQEDP